MMNSYRFLVKHYIDCKFKNIKKWINSEHEARREDRSYLMDRMNDIHRDNVMLMEAVGDSNKRIRCLEERLADLEMAGKIIDILGSRGK